MENRIIDYLEILLESKKMDLEYQSYWQPCLISEIELLEEILHEIKNNL